MNIHRLATCTVTGCILLAATSPAAAQTDPRLVQAVAVAQEGNRDSATALVRVVRNGAAAGSALYAEALYTTSILATNPDTMRRMLQQVIVEQSLSPWADDALLRLAQLDYASGNLPAAMRDLERLRTNFPNSDVFTDASFWAARTYFDARQERPGCEWVGMGLARAGDTPSTVRDQLQVFARRCSAAALSEGSAKAPPAPPRDTIVLAQAGSREAGKTDTLDAGREAVDSGLGTRDAGRQPTVDSQQSTVDRRPLTVDPRPAAEPVTPAKAGASPTPTVFRVQVVAANSQAAADAAVGKLRELGYDSRVVSEGGYFKVRAGGYGSRSDATAAVQRLRATFAGAFLVVDK
jgi:cell division septation protein DedD